MTPTPLSVYKCTDIFLLSPRPNCISPALFVPTMRLPVHTYKEQHVLGQQQKKKQNKALLFCFSALAQYYMHRLATLSIPNDSSARFVNTNCKLSLPPQDISLHCFCLQPSFSLPPFQHTCPWCFQGLPMTYATCMASAWRQIMRAQHTTCPESCVSWELRAHTRVWWAREMGPDRAKAKDWNVEERC